MQCIVHLCIFYSVYNQTTICIINSLWYTTVIVKLSGSLKTSSKNWLAAHFTWLLTSAQYITISTVADILVINSHTIHLTVSVMLLSPTRGSAIAEGPRNALVSRNSATTKYPYRMALFAWSYVYPFWYCTRVWQTHRETHRQTDTHRDTRRRHLLRLA